MYTYALIIETYCAIFMTGLIWVIQLVHYPSFEFIEEDKASHFNLFHQARISFIVAPVMLIEMSASIVCLSMKPENYLAFILLILIWASTVLFSIPCHQKLNKTHDIKIIKRLVKTNWPRTLLWSIRSLILLQALLAL